MNLSMRATLFALGLSRVMGACSEPPRVSPPGDAGADAEDVRDARADGTGTDVRVDVVAGCRDGDGDTYPAVACGGMPADCDDTNPAVHPLAPEVCDRLDVDEDCNPCTVAGTADGDADRDTYRSAACRNAFHGAAPICSRDVTVGAERVRGRDCDDANADVHPDQTESCNQIDDNCNSDIDEELTRTQWYRDRDQDGHGDPRATAVTYCANPSTPTAQYATSNDDCDDTDAFTYAGAEERCDGRGRDENCNESIDEGCACNEGASRVCQTAPGVLALGVCGAGTQICVRGAATGGAQWGPCSIQPGVEVCNGLDDDCDGGVDEPSTIPTGTPPPPSAILSDRCGTLIGGACTAGACRCPAGQESCGGTCRETGAACSVGVGGCSRSGRLLCAGTSTACSATTGAVLTPGDPTSETCNEVDDNCNGAVDEDLHASVEIRLGGEARRLCDGVFCSVVAHTACATATPTAPFCQANTGVAIYWGGDNVDAQCLTLPSSGPRAVPVHQRSSYEAIGYGTNCTSEVTDREGHPCFRAAHAWCVAQGFTTGFLTRDGVASGGQGEVFVTCLRPEHVELRTADVTQIPRSARCDIWGTRPVIVADGCGGYIRRLCRDAGFVDGWGPILVSATTTTVACLKRF